MCNCFHIFISIICQVINKAHSANYETPLDNEARKKYVTDKDDGIYYMSKNENKSVQTDIVDMATTVEVCETYVSHGAVSVLDIQDDDFETTFIGRLREKICEFRTHHKRRYYLVCDDSIIDTFEGTSMYEVWFDFILYKMSDKHIIGDIEINKFLEEGMSFMTLEDYICDDLYDVDKTNPLTLDEFIDCCVNNRFEEIDSKRMVMNI